MAAPYNVSRVGDGGVGVGWHTLPQQPTNSVVMDTEIQESYPLSFVIPITVILITENIGGLICNIVVLAVYHLSRRTLRTVSNVFITNLSIVDMLVCATSIPMTIVLVLTGRTQNHAFCFFHEATISFASCSSALNLTIISLDRYETIVSPFRRKFNLKNIKHVLIAIWVLTLIGFCSPFLALTSAAWTGLPKAPANTTFPCFMWVETAEVRIYYEIYYVVLYVIANVIMLICYISIFRAAKSRINTRMAIIKAAMLHLPGAPTVNAVAQRTNEKTITKMTLMIVSTFMVCWAPHAAVSMVSMIYGTNYRLEMAQIGCLALAYSATFLHPLLYAFMRKNFREAFRQKLILNASQKLARISPSLPRHWRTNLKDTGGNSTSRSQGSGSRDSDTRTLAGGRLISASMGGTSIDTPTRVAKKPSPLSTIQNDDNSSSVMNNTV